MSLSAVYMGDLSRVRITGTGLADGSVTVERSINGGGLWSTVRGGIAVPVIAGTITIDDYEFRPGTENQYRIRPAVETTFDVPSTDQATGDPWLVPAGVDTLEARCIGAGGTALNSGSSASSGAGGGAWAASVIDVTPGETLHVLVGRAELDGGLDGGRSTLARGGTLLVAAPGGHGVTTPGTPGTGGSDAFPAAVGDVTNAGGDGGASGDGAGGGGGAAASDLGDGGTGETPEELADAFGVLGGAGGQAPGTAIVARGTTWDVTDIFDRVLAPGLTAAGPGLLVCAWSAGDTASLTVPGSMTQDSQQTSTAEVTAAVAHETVAAGPTGSRDAVADVGLWTAASVLLYGAAAAVEDTATDAAVGAAVSATPATAGQAGWWAIAVQTIADTGPEFPTPAGEGWVILADEGLANTFGEPRTVIWGRLLAEAGPVTVDIGAPADPGDDQMLTVLLVSGVATDAATSGAGGAGGSSSGTTAMIAGVDGAHPGGGGGGRGGSVNALSGHGAHGQVRLSSWTDGTPEQTAITPVIDRVWLTCIKWPLLNRPVSVGDVEGGGRASRTGKFDVKGSPFPVVVADARSAPTFTLTLRTGTAEESRDLDLIMAAETEFLIQVPPDRPNIPGGYVTIDTYDLDRFGPVSTRRRWPLPCTVTAPPAPDIVPATLTWATVERLYGSWEALAAANPSWLALLDGVGDPEDAVIL